MNPEAPVTSRRRPDSELIGSGSIRGRGARIGRRQPLKNYRPLRADRNHSGFPGGPVCAYSSPVTTATSARSWFRCSSGAGHEVVGLDSDLFADCTFGPAVSEPRRIRPGRPRRRGRRPRRVRRRRSPRGGVQRPGRRPQPAGDLRHQPPGVGAAGQEGKGGRSRAVPVLLLVQPLRQGRGRDARRGRRVRAGNPLRRIEGPRRAGHRGPGGRLVQPDLPSERDGLRCLTAAARRRGREQPRRVRAYHGRDPDPERWNTVAPAGARRGHLLRLPRRASRAPRARSRRGVQRRRQRRELSHPRPGRDRRRGRARRQRRVRARRRPRQALVSGRLLEDRAGASRVRGSLDGEARRGGALRGVQALRPHARAVHRRALPAHPSRPRAPGGRRARPRTPLAGSRRAPDREYRSVR